MIAAMASHFAGIVLCTQKAPALRPFGKAACVQGAYYPENQVFLYAELPSEASEGSFQSVKNLVDFRRARRKC